MADKATRDPRESSEPGGTQPATGAHKSAFDPASLRLPQNFHQVAGVTKRITTIKVQKPGRQDFIRVQPDSAFGLGTMLLEFKEEGETYLVASQLWLELMGELVPKFLYLTVNRQGVVRLWPIRMPDEEGKLDDWNRSALQAAQIAMGKWVRVTSNRSLGAYEVWEADGALGEPEWPDLTFEEILEIAFRDRYIDDLGHPALKRLRGEV